MRNYKQNRFQIRHATSIVNALMGQLKLPLMSSLIDLRSDDLDHVSQMISNTASDFSKQTDLPLTKDPILPVSSKSSHVSHAVLHAKAIHNSLPKSDVSDMLGENFDVISETEAMPETNVTHATLPLSHRPKTSMDLSAQSLQQKIMTAQATLAERPGTIPFRDGFSERVLFLMKTGVSHVSIN